MAKRELSHWIRELNNYGRLRVFLNEVDARECQRGLRQMKEIIEENKRLKREVHKLELGNDSLQLQVDNPGGLL